MKDHGTALRTGYVEAFVDNLDLNGIKVPIVDGMVSQLPAIGIFGVFGSQQDTDKSNKDKWVFETSLDFAIVDKRKVSAGKKDVESIGDQVLQIVFPTIKTYGIIIAAPFNITFIKYLSGVAEDVMLDSMNHPVMIKRFQFINRITQ